MSLRDQPCEKHELTNCSICTGVDKQFDSSLTEAAYDQGLPPRIAGGPTIFANFAATCASCGRRYPKGEPIHHSREDDGWIAVSCCA